MRIGLFSDPYLPHVNGVATSVAMLKDGLEKLGHEVFVITMESEKYDKHPLPEHNVIRLAGHTYPIPSLTDYKWFVFDGSYQKIIKSLNLDIIHIHTEFAVGNLGLKMAKKLHIPYVYTMHSMYDEFMHHVFKHAQWLFRAPYNAFVRHNLHKFGDNADAVIIPHKKVQSMFDHHNVTRPLTIIPTGLDLSRFKRTNFDKKDIDKLKEELGVKDKKIILFLGRLCKEKSIDLLLENFAKMRDNLNIVFVLVGEGPAQKELENLTQKLNIKDKVIFAGSRPWDMVNKYYQIADVFVNASQSETQGLTFIEALASSVPVLARYDYNLDQTIIDGYNGYFYENAEDFDQKLTKMLTDKQLMTTLKKNAENSVDKYSIENYGKNVAKLYEEILEKRKETTK